MKLHTVQMIKRVKTKKQLEIQNSTKQLLSIFPTINFVISGKNEASFFQYLIEFLTKFGFDTNKIYTLVKLTFIFTTEYIA